LAFINGDTWAQRCIQHRLHIYIHSRIFMLQNCSTCLIIIARSRVLFEELTVTQIIKKLPAIYGTRRFITVYTTARHWSLS
jgi:hypothetical protein